MACKKTKLKVRKMKYGSQLPKKDGLLGSSYLDTNNQLFGTPSNTYDNLANYNQAQNVQQYSPGVAADDPYANLANYTKRQNDPTYGQENLSTKYRDMLGTGTGTSGGGAKGADEIFGEAGVNSQDYLALAGVAMDAIASVDEGKLSTQENQDILDSVGGIVGGAYYTGGKAADEMLFGKDEQGLYDSELAASASYFLTDPSQAMASGFAKTQEGISEGDWGSIGEGITELLLPGLAGRNYQREQEAAIKEEERKKKMLANELRLAEINAGVQNRQGLYADGGTLPNSDIPVDIKMKLFNTNKGNTQEAYYTPRVLRPRTRQNTLDTLVNQFGYSREDAKSKYSEDLLKSIADQNPNYQFGVSSIGEPVLNEYILQNSARRKLANGGQVLRKYNGQTHNGPDEGIEVDANGNPSIMTGNAPVALTEKNEVAYKSPMDESAYIFSDKIKYKKL